jgi:DNA-binding transcriptional ArsR family regulator
VPSRRSAASSWTSRQASGRGQALRPQGDVGSLRYHRRMAMRPGRAAVAEPPVPDATALSAAACMFRSLGDPARLAILRHLALGEHKVVDLTTHLGLAQSTVSGHLACLRDCGLLTSRPQGRASMWSLANAPEVRDVLAAAERLLAVTGDAVVLCPTYGEAANR